MNISLQAIERRVSTRTFDGTPLGKDEEAALTASFPETLPCPFGGTPRILLVAAGSSGFGGGAQASGKIGTYGLIAKAPAFIVGAITPGGNGIGSMEDFGYAMEGAVLRATELGLSTCWIGGLFDRTAAARSLGLKEEELIPSVIAVGHAAEGRSLVEHVTRRAAKAGTRKPSGELFFEESFGRPLVLPDTDPWLKVLEAVRSGPSATNKQPWRILRTGAPKAIAYHLFLDEDRILNSALAPVRIQNIDIGIAMRHFEAAALALGLPGAWSRLPAPPVGTVAPLLYISSWVA